MRTKAFRSKTKRSAEAGQAILFTVLGLGIFLIGAMAFAIDLSYMWLSRQSAQTAADAACTAGVMDLLVYATNGSLTSGSGGTLTFPTLSGGTPQAVDCNATTPNNSSTNPSPCVYAALNGFSSTVSNGSTNIGNNVYVDFPSPSSFPNITLAPSSLAPIKLMRVTISDNIPTLFGAMLKGLTKQHTGAVSMCGVVSVNSPIPILVLDPRNDSGTLHMNGGGSNSSTTCSSKPCGDIVIAGGGIKSIQVNSSSSSAIAFNGGPTIDLCAGGQNYCGSTLGVWGAVPSPGSSNFWTASATCSVQNNGLCTGSQNPPQWNQSPPIADPLSRVTAPAVPTCTGCSYPSPNNNGVAVVYHQSGCPDTSGCRLFSPGYYPNGIQVKGAGGGDETAIFQPGIYYLLSSACGGGASASLCENSNSCIRPSTDKGDGSGGTIFYFADTNSVAVTGGGGSCTPGGGNTIDPFPVASSPTTTGTSYLQNGVKCTASSIIPGNLVSAGSLTGSVLLAPCTGPDQTTGLCDPNCTINNGIGFGDPDGAADPFGVQRGILFFQNRAVNAGNNPSWGGNGSMLLAGTMYFHQCVTSGSDTGQNCDTSGAYNDKLSLGGTSGSSTYVLGDIIVDKLDVGGNGQIVMDLNPSSANTTLKAALVQ
jgi:hypothetical protein